MWLIFGGKTNVKQIPSGRTGRRLCTGYKEVTTFSECDVTDRFELFFLEVAQTTLRRMVCLRCGQDEDLEAFLGPPGRRADTNTPAHTDTPAHKPPASGPMRRSAPVSEAEKEAMLAALKARMKRRQ